MKPVNFIELKSSSGLRPIEGRVRRAVAAAGYPKVDVRLFKTEEGRVGYSLKVVPSDAGKTALDRIHRLVCAALGYRRGRPAARQTRQVKCRVSDAAYERLRREALRRGRTPSSLAAELVERSILGRAV